jgi:hypothetical protein
MMVEDSRRLLITNLDLRYVVSNDGDSLRPTDQNSVPGWPSNYSRDAFEFFRLFPDERRLLPISTAVRLSASFPIFSPAAVLPTFPRRSLVDAGYYDNYGVSLASSWLFSGAHANWIRGRASKIILIQIRAYETDRQRTLGRLGDDNWRILEKPADNLVSRAFEDLTTPLIGIDRARAGAASFRNDEQLELLSRYCRNDLKVPFAVMNIEMPLDQRAVPMSWYLPDQSKSLVWQEAERTVFGQARNRDGAPKKPAEVDLQDPAALGLCLWNWWNDTKPFCAKPGGSPPGSPCP